MINGFQKVLGEDEDALRQFVQAMRDFDNAFSAAMVSGVDFTLRLEVRGNKGRMLHCRVEDNRFRRTKRVQEEVERKRRERGAKEVQTIY